MKPSVGRIVHFISLGSKDGKYEPECRAAIITAVKNVAPYSVSATEISETSPKNTTDFFECDLAIFNPEGMYFNRKVLQGDKPGTWHWPERVE